MLLEIVHERTTNALRIRINLGIFHIGFSNEIHWSAEGTAELMPKSNNLTVVIGSVRQIVDEINIRAFGLRASRHGTKKI